MGVHKLGKRPHVSVSGMGVQEPYNTNLYSWFRELSERLRYVRVVCGDWSQVCGGKWQDNTGLVGIFFDPPYSGDVGRDNDLYHSEDLTVSEKVRAWCLERGNLPTYRIVLSGYNDEHQELLNHGWNLVQWKAQGGYAHTGNGQGKANRKREALYVSPHCLSNSLF